tara:strand:- start:18017 stop:18685 length:669 start_codon:yes stop_codon:yes gene_type:complete
MKTIDYWRLCDELTVREAALLLMGIDPSDMDNNTETRSLPKPYMAISRAIFIGLKGSLTGTQEILGELVNYTNGLPSDRSSTVRVSSFKEWLGGKGVKTGFFFPDSFDEPDYLNPDHPCYSPKLAAAVNAWLAVTQDKRYINNGKSPKSNIETWLTANAQNFGLVGEDGGINNTAIKDQIAKVANFQPKGGSPAIPVTQPAPPLRGNLTSTRDEMTRAFLFE